MYVFAPNGIVEKFPYSISELRADNSFRSDPPNELLASLGVFPVVSTDAQYDPVTQAATQNGCEFANGRWQTKWAVEPLSEEQAEANRSAVVAKKIQRLWQAADAYTSGYISGVAIGVLVIGVIQQLPVSLAIKAWSAQIWDEYYARKAAVTASSVVDTDFSIFGPMPHSVPELQAEVGV